MTAVAVALEVPDTPAERETVSLARRMHDGYLHAALFSLVLLAEATREAELLNARGSVLHYERAAATRDAVRADIDRYKGIVQLLRDEGLAQ